MKKLFLTVTDKNFFIGTLATINSILEHHNDEGLFIAVIDYNSDTDNGLSLDQKLFLESKNNIKIYKREDFLKEGRVIGGWQFKTYGMSDLLETNEYDIIIGIDSDCCVVSNLDDVMSLCIQDGKMRGGQDGSGPYYDNSYAAYGFATNVRNAKYMSTSLYFVANNELNKKILREAAYCTNKAVYGPQLEKIYQGHGDQGILNAVIYKLTSGDNIELLENEIWSMHWTYDQTIATYHNGFLINRTYYDKIFRSFHSPSMGKIWTRQYSDRNPINQEWIYSYFLNYLFLGELCLAHHSNPFAIISPTDGHLYNDLIKLKDKIRTINNDFYNLWDKVSINFIDAICKINNVQRMMTLDYSASMWKYIELVKGLNRFSNIAEVGSYLGGSIITLALATLHKDFNYYSIESFMGDENNTVDAAISLPSYSEYLRHVKDLFPSININLVKLQSQLASNLFPDNYFDFIMIDACHNDNCVYNDIMFWMPKLVKNGIMAGDDISWPSVRNGIKRVGIKFNEGNDLWWYFNT